MAVPTTREEVKDYVLRRLGHPVIQVNIDDDQLEDRIDDALALFYEQHYDGSEKHYLKHQVTDEDKENGYIVIPENVIGAIEVFPLYGSGGRMGDIFDLQYQIALNDLYSLTAVSLVPYVMTMTHLNMINEMLVGKMPFRYSRTKNRLYIDTDWSRITTGAWILLDCYQIVDAEEFQDVWKDRWFLAYATCLARIQWAEHLSKHSGMVLPGGVTINGLEMLQRGLDEKVRLEDELREKYTMPPLDFVG